MNDINSVPLNLYFDLENECKADWEVVLRASLEFINGIKENAYILDPDVEIKFEIISGTEGSLSLNANLSKGKKSKSKSKLSLIGVIVASSAWFTPIIGSYVIGKALDNAGAEALMIEYAEKVGIEIKGDEISREERLVEKLSELINKRHTNPHLKNTFTELEKDTSIKGIGLGFHHEKRPKTLISREKFKEFSGSIDIEEEKLRRKENIVTLSLIGPILLNKKNRRWKFLGPVGEFGATIDDAQFVTELLSGQIKTPMVAGIEMEVILETVERQINGLWQNPTYSIQRVRNIKPPQWQSSMEID